MMTLPGLINCGKAGPLGLVPGIFTHGPVGQVTIANIPDSCTKQWSFVVDEFHCISETCPRPNPITMVTKIRKFSQKNCYNSASIADMSPILAPNRGFSGSASQISLGLTLVAMVTNHCCLNIKLAITRLENKPVHNSDIK